MSKKEKVPYFHGDQWFRRNVEERTRRALKEKEAAFAQDHAGDTDGELLDYVCRMAKELGYTPTPPEIIGGGYIACRFGSWSNVCARAGLRQTHFKAPQMVHRAIFKQEYIVQARLFQQSRRDGTDPKVAERRVRKEAAHAREVERQRQDKLWGQAHQHDTDEQLLEHVRGCAAELGRTPRVGECPGADYIIKRFGSWSMALTCAGLPLLAGMKPPSVKVIQAYRERSAARKTAAVENLVNAD